MSGFNPSNNNNNRLFNQYHQPNQSSPDDPAADNNPNLPLQQASESSASPQHRIFFNGHQNVTSSIIPSPAQPRPPMNPFHAEISGPTPCYQPPPTVHPRFPSLPPATFLQMVSNPAVDNSSPMKLFPTVDDKGPAAPPKITPHGSSRTPRRRRIRESQPQRPSSYSPSRRGFVSDDEIQNQVLQQPKYECPELPAHLVAASQSPPPAGFRKLQQQQEEAESSLQRDSAPTNDLKPEQQQQQQHKLPVTCYPTPPEGRQQQFPAISLPSVDGKSSCMSSVLLDGYRKCGCRICRHGLRNLSATTAAAAKGRGGRRGRSEGERRGKGGRRRGKAVRSRRRKKGNRSRGQKSEKAGSLWSTAGGPTTTATGPTTTAGGHATPSYSRSASVPTATGRRGKRQQQRSADNPTNFKNCTSRSISNSGVGGILLKSPSYETPIYSIVCSPTAAKSCSSSSSTTSITVEVIHEPEAKGRGRHGRRLRSSKGHRKKKDGRSTKHTRKSARIAKMKRASARKMKPGTKRASARKAKTKRASVNRSPSRRRTKGKKKAHTRKSPKPNLGKRQKRTTQSSSMDVTVNIESESDIH